MIVTDLATFKRLDSGETTWTVDIETYRTDYYTDKAKLLGIGIGFHGKDVACYVPISYWNKKTFAQAPTEEALISYISDTLSKRNLVMHNSFFDYGWLKTRCNSNIKVYWDTRLAWHILEPEAQHYYGLDEAARLVFNLPSHKETFDSYIKSKGGNPGDVYLAELEKVADYCCKDVELTTRLYQYQKPQIETFECVSLLQDFLLRYQDILINQYIYGLRINKKSMRSYRERLVKYTELLDKEVKDVCSKEIASIENKMFLAELAKKKTPKAIKEWTTNPEKRERFRFNFRSRQQLGLLLAELGINVYEKTEKGATKTDVETLYRYRNSHPAIALLNKRNEADSKIKFVEQYEEATDNDVYHGEPDMCGTASGRLVYFKPNLLAAPRGHKRLMHAFEARPGYKFIQFDFSSIEPVIEAHFTDNKELITSIKENKDIYLELVKYIFPDKANLYDPKDIEGSKNRLKEERKMLKTVRLGLGYGMGTRKLAVKLGVDEREAKRISDKYWDVMYPIKNFQNQLLVRYMNYGRGKEPVKNLFNRPIIMKHQDDIVNRFIQSSAHDCLVYMNILLDDNISIAKLDAHPVVCDWHDECIYEVAEEDLDEYIKILYRTLDQMNAQVGLVTGLTINHRIVSRFSEVPK